MYCTYKADEGDASNIDSFVNLCLWAYISNASWHDFACGLRA